MTLAHAAGAATCYVNAAAGGSNNGTSWADAYIDLQSALTNYPTCLAVFVARGTYKPTSTTDRTISFSVKPNVFVYGGFAGTEATTDDRLLPANETILSGDIGTAGDGSDNSYHVVVFDGTTASGSIVTANTLLSDFTVRDGHANGAGTNQGIGAGVFCNGNGAGHECSPELAHLVLENNTAQSGGGGVYADGHASGKSSPWLHDSIVRDNRVLDSNGGGGGMYDNGNAAGVASPLIEQVTFSGNSAGTGGAIYNYGLSGTSSPTIRNSTFYANTVSGYGGAIADNGALGHASPILRYSTFTQNVAAGNGGAIYNIAPSGDAAPNISGVIFWADQATGSPVENYTYASNTTSTLEYSITPECPGGATGCKNADPLLRPLSDNDGFGPSLMPDVGSPAIDAGNATNCPAFDSRGVARPQGTTCDIGAVELRAADRARCYVNSANAGVSNGQSWATAYATIYPALISANCTEVWVAKSATYYSANNLLDVAAFSIPPGKAVYGGFAGTETARSQRDPVKNETILNGLGMWHVVAIDAPGSGKNVGGSTVLDGFTITGGNANSTGLNQFGGGLICNGNQGYTCNPTLANLVLKNNSAVEAGGMMLNGSGGMSSPTLTSITFVDNQASTQCGALEATGVSGVSSPVLKHGTFTHNTAATAGGAACFLGKQGVSKPQLEASLFDSNSGSSGGAIAAAATDMTLSHVTFRSNQATPNYGGGVYLSDHDGPASALFTSVAFAGNGGYGSGGGVFLDFLAHGTSTARFERATFAANVAGANSFGGGVFFEGGNVIVVDSLFANNVASKSGGGIGGAYGTLSVDRSAFAGDNATNSGGAIEADGTTTVVSSSSFRGNYASTLGGGAISISATPSGPGSLQLRNSTLSRNFSSTAGGALIVDPFSLGVSAQAALTDTIIWGNTAPTDAAIHRGPSGSVSIDHGIEQGGCPLGSTCNVLLTSDPQLLPVFETYGGLTPAFMPSVHSPAVDIGSGCVSTDQRNVARPQGATCDIGAIELTSTDDTLFNDNFNASGFEPAYYDPTQCAKVANSLDIYWVEIDGETCVGIEHTDGDFVAAADGSFSMTGLSVSDPSCLVPDAYSFTLSADGRTLSGSDTVAAVPMTLTRSSDGNCFIGHWISGPYEFVATIWNFTRQ